MDAADVSRFAPWLDNESCVSLLPQKINKRCCKMTVAFKEAVAKLVYEDKSLGVVRKIMANFGITSGQGPFR